MSAAQTIRPMLPANASHEDVARAVNALAMQLELIRHQVSAVGTRVEHMHTCIEERFRILGEQIEAAILKRST